MTCCEPSLCSGLECLTRELKRHLRRHLELRVGGEGLYPPPPVRGISEDTCGGLSTMWCGSTPLFSIAQRASPR